MDTSDQALRQQLKELLISTLHLPSVKPEDITDDEPLFSKESKLGLDSLGALELLSAVEYTYQVQFETDDSSARQHFASIASLAAFVRSRRT